MAAFPASLRLRDAVVARRDASRLVVCFVKPVEGGKPALTGAVRQRLAKTGLVVEGDPGPGGDPRTLRAVNHGPDLVWLRSIHKAKALPTRAALEKAFGRRLSWAAPAYRLPKLPERDALFCARPDVLLVRPAPGDEESLAGIAAKYRLHEETERSRHLRGWRYLRLPEAWGTTALVIAASARRQAPAPEVDLEYVPFRSPFAFTPDDALFGDQWGMVQIDAPAAWDIETGDRAVVVAVIDSGCDLGHADLSGAYVSRGTNVSDPSLDGSPIVDAPSGSGEWHGTAVAGVVAAALNNSIGVAGLAGGCGILPVALAVGSTTEMAAAVDYAVGEGAAILNMSLSIGSYWFETWVRPSIDAAVTAGCVVCAAAGNDDSSTLTLPARYPSVMACGGSDRADRRWQASGTPYGSEYGDEIYDGAPTGVSVVAPATNIVSTDISGPDGFTPAASPAGDYLYGSDAIPSPFDATSAATPHVAGAAALLRSRYPGLGAVAIRRVIERTAEKVGGYAYADVDGYPSGSRHPEVGYGRLNVFRALDFGDVMIRDWPGDDGIEPSTPPGGNFFGYSDIVIQPGTGGEFRPDRPDLSSVLTRGLDHTVSVRVTSVGPADARGVRAEVRATPFVGLEFAYPDDWTAIDALHVRPTPVDAGPFAVPAGGDHIATFGFTAAEVDGLAGWTDMGWHPCLLGMATAVNDYAFADAPAGPFMVMRRNNLAQRNLTVSTLTMDAARFPFAIGHPATKDPRLLLVIEAGGLARTGGVHLVLTDSSRAFPAARKAKAFASGELKVAHVAGGKVASLGNQRAVQVLAPRALVELVRPAQGRFAVHLAVKLPAVLPRGTLVPIRVTQFVGLRATGGATVMFTGR